MVLGSLLRKTAVSGAISGSRAENTCCCSYCCIGVHKTEIWLGPPKSTIENILPQERYQLIVELDLCCLPFVT